MIDMSNTEKAAIREVYGNNMTILYCWFHVVQACSRQFVKKLPRNSADEAQKDFNEMMFAKTIDEYRLKKNNFIEKWRANSNFLTYISGQYFSNEELWAKAFRTGVCENINTNNYIESWHKKLKYFFLKDRPNRRLDRLIWILSDTVEKWYLQESARISCGVGRMTRSERFRLLKEIEAKAKVNDQEWVARITYDPPHIIVPSFSPNGYDKTVSVNESSILRCNCEYFESCSLPCKHMMAINVLDNDYTIHNSFVVSEVFNVSVRASKTPIVRLII